MDVEEQVDILLGPAPPDEAAAYFENLTAGRGVRVAPDAGGGRGKGLFAARAFRGPAAAGGEGELVLAEPPLVGVCLERAAGQRVCGHCFAHVGSVEEQVAAGLGLHARALAAASGAAGLPEVLDRLARGELRLPTAAELGGGGGGAAVPAAVPCPTGCAPGAGAAPEEGPYCSRACAAAAAARGHALLCLGAGGAAAADPGRAAALRDFYALAAASEYGEALLLAARALADVYSRYRRQLAAAKAAAPPKGAAGSPGAAAGAEARRWAALRAAWLPYWVAHKPPWWDTVAPPRGAGAAGFRAGLRAEAEAPLRALRAALPGDVPRALAHARVWGALMGQMEVNNLHSFVPGPVPAWMAAARDAPPARVPRGAAAAVLAALEAALDDELVTEEDWGVRLNAFFALQACCNHSCAPSAAAHKRAADRDGGAVLLALRDIAEGEEVTISYIDEDAPLAERRARLRRDYLFECRCERCLAEEAEEAQRRDGGGGGGGGGGGAT